MIEERHPTLLLLAQPSRSAGHTFIKNNTLFKMKREYTVPGEKPPDKSPPVKS